MTADPGAGGVSAQRNRNLAIVVVGSVGTAIAYARLIRGSAGALALGL